MTETRCRGRIAAGTLLIVVSGTPTLAGLVESASSPTPAAFSLTDLRFVASLSVESRSEAGRIVDPANLHLSGPLSVWAPSELEAPLDAGVASVGFDPGLLAYAGTGSPVVITARDDRGGVDRVQDPQDRVGSAELDVGTGPSQVVVPEPSVLVLMLLGLPALVRARRKYSTNR